MIKLKKVSNYNMFLESLSAQEFEEGKQEYINRIKELLSDFDNKIFTVKDYDYGFIDLLSTLKVKAETHNGKQGYDISISVSMKKQNEDAYNKELFRMELNEKYLYLWKDASVKFTDEQISKFRRLLNICKNLIKNPLEISELYNRLEWFGTSVIVDYEVKIN